jgi:hypothetical protein
VKDPEVRTVYLDMAARWRRMAARKKASMTSCWTYEKREKWDVAKPEDQAPKRNGVFYCETLPFPTVSE